MRESIWMNPASARPEYPANIIICRNGTIKTMQQANGITMRCNLFFKNDLMPRLWIRSAEKKPASRKKVCSRNAWTLTRILPMWRAQWRNPFRPTLPGFHSWYGRNSFWSVTMPARPLYLRLYAYTLQIHFPRLLLLPRSDILNIRGACLRQMSGFHLQAPSPSGPGSTC